MELEPKNEAHALGKPTSTRHVQYPASPQFEALRYRDISGLLPWQLCP